MTSPAIVLFAHGARDPKWANPIQKVRAAMLALQPDVRVELAFLELMEPDLPTCIARLIQERTRRVVVVPMFIATGRHLKTDLPELLKRLSKAHPGIELSLVGAVGEAEPVIAAMAGYAITSASSGTGA